MPPSFERWCWSEAQRQIHKFFLRVVGPNRKAGVEEAEEAICSNLLSESEENAFQPAGTLVRIDRCQLKKSSCWKTTWWCARIWSSSCATNVTMLPRRPLSPKRKICSRETTLTS